MADSKIVGRLGSRDKRRYFSSDVKLRIIREQITDNISINNICSEYDLELTMYYRWRKELLERGEKFFKSRRTCQESAIGCSKGKLVIRKEVALINQNWMLDILQGKTTVSSLATSIDNQLSYQEIYLLINNILNKPLRYRNRGISILAWVFRSNSGSHSAAIQAAVPLQIRHPFRSISGTSNA